MKTDFPMAAVGSCHLPPNAMGKSYRASHTQIQTLPGNKVRYFN